MADRAILEEGMTVFYVEDSEVFSGMVIDVEKMADGRVEFSIDSYGACEGHYRISSGQLGKTVFLSEEDARACYPNPSQV